MKKEFSNKWKRSKQPRKQRKYRHNAPLHVLSKFMNSHFSKELRTKYNRRSIRVRTGDKVKILRGQYKKITGKVNSVNVTKTKIYVEGAQLTKRDGSKAYYPINPSNVMIVELDLTDKIRKAKLESKNAPQKTKRT